ncbi:MAG: D-glycero-beta-D-manno-heptose 1-phosphate adenylyltransferase [Chitinophagales bacterium]|nr:D-glycero-beta-D-manno-heptose 1-phosphate adenylyltransferase [Chitinophagaceae bacterium]MCB9063812.1 D-glycero-beta-D-manno-heptose 1-phosphate adenylyltransferase [Chitinophagales bacterium]
MQKLQWIQNKILNSDDLKRICNVWRSTGNKIVFTNGCFDILHHGHIHLLAEAASLGNKLIVGLNTDSSVRKLKGADRPVTQENDRALQLAAMLVVDAVCFFDEETPEELIKTVTPDVLVKGGDYEIKDIVGADYVQSHGGTVTTIPFVQGYSTSSILERIKKL